MIFFNLFQSNKMSTEFKYKNCIEASKNGDLETLKRMHLDGFEWDEWTPANAAGNGHLDCLKYAHENGCDWNKWTTANAASFGHLDCLKYAHENGCIWDEETTAQAAGNGHLDCLQYSHENGCPWDTKTTINAAFRGYLDCLKYAYNNGCPWDYKIQDSAALNGNITIFKYSFQICNDPQEFWNYKYNLDGTTYSIHSYNEILRRYFDPNFKIINYNYDLTKIIDKIDLDDPLWRKLLTLNLNFYPELQTKVQSKIKKLEELKLNIKEILSSTLSFDVIKFYIFPYL
jgi:hypothetical protein